MCTRLFRIRNIPKTGKGRLPPSEVLIEKYMNDCWAYALDEYPDVCLNTESHDVYDNHTEADVLQAFEDADGHHHIYVYDETNVMAMIVFVIERGGSELINFDSRNNRELHFASRR